LLDVHGSAYLKNIAFTESNDSSKNILKIQLLNNSNFRQSLITLSQIKEVHQLKSNSINISLRQELTNPSLFEKFKDET